MKFLFILFILFNSCSLPKVSHKKLNYTKKYLFEDGSGKFTLKRQVGIKKNKLITKRIVFINYKKPLEQSIAFSKLGYLKNKKAVRPDIAQYSVWFDKEKYFSQLKIMPKERKVEIKNIINNKKEELSSVKLPKNKFFYCFFSQVIECLKYNSAFEMLQRKDAIQFNILFDGYPYLQEQYPTLPNKVVSIATIKADGKGGDKFLRLALSIGSETLFYFVDKNLDLEKIFWVSQGLSIYPQK